MSLSMWNQNLVVSWTPVKDDFTSVVDTSEEFLSDVVDTSEAL
jgi:hypothetical protein